MQDGAFLRLWRCFLGYILRCASSAFQHRRGAVPVASKVVVQSTRGVAVLLPLGLPIIACRTFDGCLLPHSRKAVVVGVVVVVDVVVDNANKVDDGDALCDHTIVPCCC